MIYLIDTLNCRVQIYNRHSNFPTPNRDSLLGSIDSNEFCAFQSIESVQEWIEPSWMEELAQEGFKVLMLDVSDCRIGEYQVLYKKADILQTKDITSLFITK